MLSRAALQELRSTTRYPRLQAQQLQAFSGTADDESTASYDEHDHGHIDSQQGHLSLERGWGQVSDGAAGAISRCLRTLLPTYLP